MSQKHTTENTQGQDLDLGEVYTRTELFLEKNKKNLTIGAVAIVGVVAAALAYQYGYAKPRAAEASEL
ncbi:MAG: hypothetical protein ACK46C_07315, partial [Flavobacteriales bacterium]